MVGKSINFEKEFLKDGELIVKVNSKDVQVFGCGSNGEKICFLKNEQLYTIKKTMHLHSYHIGQGWAKYHTGIYQDIAKEIKLVKW